MTNKLKLIINRRHVLAGASALGLSLTSGCSTSKSKRFNAQIIVLGAGLSGLHAARLLETEGRDVLVLEGSNRIGGRLHTLRHKSGAYTEAGGEQVGASYARVLDTSNQLGINLTPDTAVRRGVTYGYNGKLYSPQDWAKFDAHPFAPPFKGASPASPLFRLAAKNNPFENPDDWRDSRFAKYDISARQFLTQNKIHAASQKTIEHTLNGNNLSTYSIMNLYRSLQLYTQSAQAGPSLSIDGGAQTLPKAMAKSLARPVITESMISAIDVTADLVTVTDAKGRTFKAEHCICALPFGALRKIKLNAPLPETQRSAISNLPYTQILQLHFKVDTAYWETDTLPPDMWMDGALERIFINRDTQSNPTQYGRVWINGDAAAQLSLMTDNDLGQLLQQQLSKLRPIAARDIELLAVKRWTAKNALVGGAYMHWAPSQIQNWAATMGQSAGRISFAGEHLSLMHTGLEGAMEAGENAALSLLGL